MLSRFFRSGQSRRLVQQVAELQSRLGQITAERDGLANYLPSVTAARDAALAAAEGANAAAGKAAEAIAELQQKQAAAEAAFSREIAELAAERDRLLAESQRLQAEGDGLRGTIVELKTLLGDITAERDGLANFLPSVTEARDAATARADELANHLAVLERDNASLVHIQAELQQAMAKQRLPPLLITTMPKSGTYFIAELFSRGLFIDSKIVSQQYFPDDAIRQPALRDLMNGNAVTQDHFSASPINLTHIARHIGRVLVHLRDPRQALLSYIHYLNTERFRANTAETLLFIYPPLPDNFYQQDLSAQIDWGIDFWLPELISWTEHWVEAEQGGTVQVKFTHFEDMVRDRDRFVGEILDFFGIQRERFVQPAFDAADATHFRRGEIDEWREAFTPEQRKRATAAIPAGLAARFGWTSEI